MKTTPVYTSNYCSETFPDGSFKVQVLDGNGWCKECNEINTFCDSCTMIEVANSGSYNNAALSLRNAIPKAPRCNNCIRPAFSQYYPNVAYPSMILYATSTNINQ